MKSLSEIETTSKRASRAAGFSWGISEEVGKCIRLLELFGLPGIKNLNDYFHNKDFKKFEHLNLINKDNQPQKLPFCPITLGVSFLDQIRTLEAFNKCTFKEIVYPILFLPFLSRSSEALGKRILCKIDQKEFLFNFNQTIYSNYLKSEILKNCELINISFLENINTFSQDEWEEIYKLSENTFVEENESLKKDAAGAGLTDND